MTDLIINNSAREKAQQNYFVIHKLVSTTYGNIEAKVLWCTFKKNKKTLPIYHLKVWSKETEKRQSKISESRSFEPREVYTLLELTQWKINTPLQLSVLWCYNGTAIRGLDHGAEWLPYTSLHHGNPRCTTWPKFVNIVFWFSQA